MDSSKTTVMLICCWFLFTLLGAAELTEQERQKIEQAIPGKAAVKPKKPRRLLVTNFVYIKDKPGYGHTSIPHGNLALELMGKQTGAYEMVLDNDTLMFRPENLSQFDAVCFNNTTGVLFTDPVLRKSLLDFIQSGKGFIGFHAAGATMCQYPRYDYWPEFGEMLGGFEDGGHPWTPDEYMQIKLDDPGHPLNAAFGGKGFRIKDEAFQFRHGYSRENLRILLAIDADDADFQRRRILPERMKDRDLAISWIRNYDKGRVFYCSLGHNPETFSNPVILKHFLAGIQFALGDYDVDATPSMKARTPDNILNEMKTYEYGASRLPLTHLSDLIRDALTSPDRLRKIEKQLLLFLQSPATLAAKEYVCRELRIIGSEQAVPVLAALLNDAKTSGMARYALESMPFESVDRILIEALSKTEGLNRIGIINTLAHRRSANAVPELSRLCFDADRNTASAALSAMGEIGGPEATAFLKKWAEDTQNPMHRAILKAYLKCGDRFLAAGNTTDAIAVYRHVYTMKKTDPFGIEAFRGLITADKDNAENLLVKALVGKDSLLQKQAIAMTRGIPGQKLTKTLVSVLPGLDETGQIQSLSVLAGRGDIMALPVIINATKHAQEPVRIAALDALGISGDSSTVMLLAERAAYAAGAEKKAARENLYRIKGAGIDQAILDHLRHAVSDIRIELVRSTARRKIDNAAKLLLKTAQDPEMEVRVECYKSLAILAGPEQLPDMLGLLARVEDETERAEAARAVGLVAKKIPGKEDRSKVIIDSYNAAKDEKYKSSLLLVLINIGDKQSIPLITSALKTNNITGSVVLSAVSEHWPQADAEIVKTLLSIAANSKDNVRINKALRGYIRLVRIDNSLSHQEKVTMYQQAMDLASAKEIPVREMILSGLARLPGFDALTMAASYLEDTSLQPEAESAIMAIAPETLQQHPQETRMILEKVRSMTQDDYRRQQVDRLLSGEEE